MTAPWPCCLPCGHCAACDGTCKTTLCCCFARSCSAVMWVQGAQSSEDFRGNFQGRNDIEQLSALHNDVDFIFYSQPQLGVTFISSALAFSCEWAHAGCSMSIAAYAVSQAASRSASCQTAGCQAVLHSTFTLTAPAYETITATPFHSELPVLSRASDSPGPAI